MSFCGFANGAGMFDVTPIENIFLLEYLPTAPEDFLRVYLYARMLCLHPELGSDMADMAKTLRLEEDTVYNAFTYWEQQGLVRRLTDRPPTYEIQPLNSGAVCSISPMDRDYYEYRDFNSKLQNYFAANDLLQPREYAMANDWLNVLGFEQAAVLRMVEYEVGRSRSKKSHSVFKRLDKLAVEWADKGVRTLEDVEKAISFDGEVAETAQAVIKRFGMRRRPTDDETECVRRWLRDWKLTAEDVLSACAETTKASQPSFGYLDAVLRSRVSGGDQLREGLISVLRELGLPASQPTPDQQKSYATLLSQGFDPATIELAAVQCKRKNKSRFEEVEWMLSKWAEKGLYSPDAAQAYVQDMQRKAEEVRRLLEKCGLERRPLNSDLEMYESWQSSYSPELISFAAECARGTQLPIRYMDRLLNEWHKNGVTTLEEARAQHAAGKPGRASGPQTGNPALNYAQRTYTEEDYGEDFFVDLGKGNGGDNA